MRFSRYKSSTINSQRRTDPVIGDQHAGIDPKLPNNPAAIEDIPERICNSFQVALRSDQAGEKAAAAEGDEAGNAFAKSLAGETRWQDVDR